eukprot:SAG22_NODE_159_length_16948_cov_14.480503_6_plen_175_part_00
MVSEGRQGRLRTVPMYTSGGWRKVRTQVKLYICLYIVDRRTRFTDAKPIFNHVFENFDIRYIYVHSCTTQISDLELAPATRAADGGTHNLSSPAEPEADRGHGAKQAPPRHGPPHSTWRPAGRPRFQPGPSGRCPAVRQLPRIDGNERVALRVTVSVCNTAEERARLATQERAW